MDSELRIPVILKGSVQILKKYFLRFALSFGLIIVFNFLRTYNKDLLQNYHISLRVFGSITLFLINSYLLSLFMKMSVIAYTKKPVLNHIKIPIKTFIYKLIADLLTNAIILIGLVLLIIPGIIFALKLQYTPYAVLHRDLDPINAIKLSWNITKNIKMKLFYLTLILVLINLLGIFLLFIGIFITYPIFTLSQAGVYLLLTKREHKLN